MKIEIWSDVMCPFCYIGKRHFEAALAQIPDADKIEVIWKSYQLDPTTPLEVNYTQAEYLVKKKNFPLDQVNAMLQNVTQMAKNAGLDFNLEQSVMTNSQRAHQLIQFAKSKNLGDEMEEQLFQAYFIDGKNVSDFATLSELAQNAGLDKTEAQQAFEDDRYEKEFRSDVQEAAQLGVTGVPFFVIDRKYAISGAQPIAVFRDSIQQALKETGVLTNVQGTNTDGDSCSVDGVC